MKQSTDANQAYARLAWRMIVLAFLVFCVLTIGLCYGLWRVKAFARSQPDTPARLRNSSSGVEIMRKGMVQPELPNPQTILYQGDTIRTTSSTAPGVVTTIELFDGSTIDMWSGSQLVLERIQTTRFSTRNQQIALRLQHGQIRLNLVSPSTRQYQDVEYLVYIEQRNQSLEQATLDLGGVYRMRVLEHGAPTTSYKEQRAFKDKDRTASEYVVEQGQLTLAYANNVVELGSGQATRVADGTITGVQTPEWELLRDGGFSDFTEFEYNNTTIITTTPIRKSDTWFVYGNPSPGAELDGYFFITNSCLEFTLNNPNECRIPINHVAQFRRNQPLGHEKSFTTGITQTVEMDVTGFNSVTLEFDGRITLQSLDRAGDKGVECALGVQVDYTTKENALASQTFCFYARDEGVGELSNEPYITSLKLPIEQWQHQRLSIHTIPTLRRVNSIRFYGNGHDYVSEIANVRLIAR